MYVQDVKSRLPRPEKELVAFKKVALEEGETKHISIQLDKYAVGYYDTAIQRWIAEEGTFRVLVGASAADIKYVVPRTKSTAPETPTAEIFLLTRCLRHTVFFEVKESFTWIF